MCGKTASLLLLRCIRSLSIACYDCAPLGFQIFERERVCDCCGERTITRACVYEKHGGADRERERESVLTVVASLGSNEVWA